MSRLRDALGHLALFFWNEMEANEIYVLWRPKALLPSPFGLLNAKFKSLITSSFKKSKGKEEREAQEQGKKRKKEESEAEERSSSFFVVNMPEVVQEMMRLSDHLVSVSAFH